MPPTPIIVFLIMKRISKHQDASNKAYFSTAIRNINTKTMASSQSFASDSDRSYRAKRSSTSPTHTHIFLSFFSAQFLYGNKRNIIHARSPTTHTITYMLFKMTSSMMVRKMFSPAQKQQQQQLRRRQWYEAEFYVAVLLLLLMVARGSTRINRASP